MHKRFFWHVYLFILPQIDATTNTTENFDQMKEFSIRIAVWLHKQGVGPREVVAISCSRHSKLYSIICATFYLGAIYSPWHYKLDLST